MGMHRGRARILTAALAATAALTLAGCGHGIGEQFTLPPPGPPGPSLSWTGSWVPGSQTGAIAFTAVGQTATLSATASSSTQQPPYPVYLSTGCTSVTTSSSTMTTTVQITASSAGSCTVSVGSVGVGNLSTIQATVP